MHLNACVCVCVHKYGLNGTTLLVATLLSLKAVDCLAKAQWAWRAFFCIAG